MKDFKILLLPLLLLSAAAYPLKADQFQLSLFQTGADNLYQTALGTSDRISSFALSWNGRAGRFTLFADGDYAYLWRSTGLSYLTLGGGADYLYAPGEKTALYVSLEGRGALYRSDYDDFNYGAVRLTAAVKTYLSPTSILKASALSEYRSFRTEIFNALSQTLNLSLDKYFQTKTTLKAEAGWGYKYFLQPQAAGTIAAEAAAPAPLGGGVNSGSGPGGWRSGRGGGVQAPFLYRSSGKGIQIASLSGLVAQGLGDRVGFRLTGIRQWFLSGENPFTYVEEFYMVENPTYDDFSWEGFGWNAQLTFLMPWEAELKAGYSAGRKEFPGIEALGLEGTGLGMMRKDTRRQFEVRVEKDFARMSLFLAYAHIRNDSNDPLFHWNGGFISGGLVWNFATGAVQ